MQNRGPVLLVIAVWPEEAVKQLANIELAEQRVVDLFGVSEAELRESLAPQTPGVAALFNALIGTYSQKKGKPRWAEKTPRHLLHLDTIRQAYPQAKIIRIIRDPRDSALSMCQLPWASNNPLANFYICCEWFEKSNPFFGQDKNSLTVSYEKLILDPVSTLQEICDYIDETFQEGMLETSQTGKDVASANEKWKTQVSQKLDPGRLYRWKRELPAEQITAMEYIGNKWLHYFGYEYTENSDITLYLLYFGRGEIDKYASDFITLSQNRVACLQTTSLLEPEQLLFSVETKEYRRRRHKFWLGLVKRRLMGKKTYVLFPAETKLPYLEKLMLKMLVKQIMTRPKDVALD